MLWWWSFCCECEPRQMPRQAQPSGSSGHIFIYTFGPHMTSQRLTLRTTVCSTVQLLFRVGPMFGGCGILPWSRCDTSAPMRPIRFNKVFGLCNGHRCKNAASITLVTSWSYKELSQRCLSTSFHSVDVAWCFIGDLYDPWSRVNQLSKQGTSHVSQNQN